MKTQARNGPAESAEELIPWHLSEWADTTQLAEWVETVVASLDWENPAVEELRQQHPEFHPRALLNVLALAYGLGTVAAEQIAERCREEAVFQRVCGGEPPTAQELNEFRGANRKLLEGILVEVMKRALKAKYGCTILPPLVSHQIVRSATARLEAAAQEGRQALAA